MHESKMNIFLYTSQVQYTEEKITVFCYKIALTTKEVEMLSDGTGRQRRDKGQAEILRF